MGRKGPRAKRYIVLKSMSKVDQFGSMHNLKSPTFRLNLLSDKSASFGELVYFIAAS